MNGEEHLYVGNSTVVGVHFELKTQDGESIESTSGKDPFLYIHGANEIIEGLEDALEDLKEGDEFEVMVPPENGYGLIDPKQIAKVDLENFPKDAELKIGQKFFTEGPEGTQEIRIKEILKDVAVIDGNHELAGKTLHYKGRVVSIREATEAELNHGTVGSPCCSEGTCSSEG